MDRTEDRYLGTFKTNEQAELICDMYVANCLNPVDHEMVIVNKGGSYSSRSVPF